VEIESLVRGCGVGFCRSADPLELPAFTALVKEAVAWSRRHGPAVVIARHPCLLDRHAPSDARPWLNVAVTDACDGCGFCQSQFECPALVMEAGGQRVGVDRMLCSGCGVCVHVCPKHAIVCQEPS
jgi:indolepyruvate ferredoxin oxidoreductase alpha subunit